MPTVKIVVAGSNMIEIPVSLEQAVSQAKEATKIALEAGVKRICIEIIIPEIALQSQDLTLEFISIFENKESGLKVFFPDTGSAALARRDWGKTIFEISDLGNRGITIENKLLETDQILLLVAPSFTEIGAIEKLCSLANNRPIIFLIPQFEDMSIVGIGYVAREIQKRFLNTLESVYYFHPLDEFLIVHSYCSPWYTYSRKEESYQLINKKNHKPSQEDLESLIVNEVTASNHNVSQLSRTGFLTEIQRFMNFLSK
ncbi:hypothetical protein CPARK_000044700 [cyanobacterium endosymbiont of Braarudosphaera bigelowii]|uniref:DUF1995 domain-containing protein n=3 Tax=Candidatus Atelocyanobacterium thalassae TaxID=713887 RepID=A0ABM7U4M5_9CHRO|nr:hypothetical protein CPARK_000044700 [cyanobacterium endosymbiont of Braarudosphaera bigelowii]